MKKLSKLGVIKYHPEPKISQTSQATGQISQNITVQVNQAENDNILTQSGSSLSSRPFSGVYTVFSKLVVQSLIEILLLVTYFLIH
jgi:hypothetical protein